MKQKSSSNQSTKRSRNLRSRWHWDSVLPQLPQEPGVYYFLSKRGEVIYVGKASNLKKRILSYTRKNNPNPKTLLMLSHAHEVSWIKEESDFDAILTEAEMIRTHQPKFNFRLKDDKSPLYILITNEDFPRVLTVRKSELSDKDAKRRLFGPYPSAYQTRKVLKSVRSAFPFCNAPSYQKKRKKACFYSHLGLCPGACTGKISKKEYAQIINNLRLFLLGKKAKIVKDLEKEMHNASKKLNFEKANQLKDQLLAIQTITQTSATYTWEDTFDTSNKNQDKARLLLWKTLAPLIAKKDILPPKNPFYRIEAYDVSNLQGKQATGSMVVFLKGVPEPSQYRRFRIRWMAEPNDPAMLAEVITRRLKHRNWPLPDLIIVDGGKSQVGAAKRVLASYGLHHKIPVLGIAKRFENLIFHKNIFHILNLPRRSEALKLVMHLRDEAHRFARGYHTLLRQKTLTETSSLRNT